MVDISVTPRYCTSSTKFKPLVIATCLRGVVTKISNEFSLSIQKALLT